MQVAVVSLIVAWCALHATWALLPARARTPLARWLTGWPGLGRAWQRLPAVARAAQGAGTGCHCDSCPAAGPGPRTTPATGAADPATTVTTEQPLRWMPRPPRH